MRRHLTRSLLALTGSLLAATAMSVRAQALLPGTVAGTSSTWTHHHTVLY